MRPTSSRSHRTSGEIQPSEPAGRRGSHIVHSTPPGAIIHGPPSTTHLVPTTFQTRLMGIRYSAFAVPPQLVEQASTSLRDFLAAAPWSDPCDPDIAFPPTLDLDKSWRELQAIFGPEASPSPAYELVRGDVTHTACGWIPFQRFLAPAQVKAVAADLADVDECFVMDGLAAVVRRGSFESDVSYALEYIARAREFTSLLSTSASGLVYSIG